MLINGKLIAEKIEQDLKERVMFLPFVPKFFDVVVGNDPVSLQYVGVKEKAAKRIGVEFEKILMPETSAIQEVVQKIEGLNKVNNVCGIIVQLPLPKGLDTQTVLDAIDTRLDVDVVGGSASSVFYSGEQSLVPPTAGAILEIVDSLNESLGNKKFVVVGKGNLVGRPVVRLLNNRGIEPVVVDRSTNEPEKIFLQADVLISGTGSSEFLKGNMVKPGAVVIDAGTSEMAGSVVGDVHTETVKNVASFLAPVPGGVGPVTVAKLFENVLVVAERFV